MQRGIRLRRISLFVAAVAALVVLGIETWISVGTSIPTGGALASPSGTSMTIGAKMPTSTYDDYDIVVD
jgi:hypothetical protein